MSMDTLDSFTAGNSTLLEKIESPAAQRDREKSAERKAERDQPRREREEKREAKREVAAAKATDGFSLVDEDPKRAAAESERVRDMRKFQQDIKPSSPTVEPAGGSVGDRKWREEQRPPTRTEDVKPIQSVTPQDTSGTPQTVICVFYDGTNLSIHEAQLNNVVDLGEFSG